MSSVREAIVTKWRQVCVEVETGTRSALGRDWDEYPLSMAISLISYAPTTVQVGNFENTCIAI